jgi:RecB family endonuclease NucS
MFYKSYSNGIYLISILVFVKCEFDINQVNILFIGENIKQVEYHTHLGVCLSSNCKWCYQNFTNHVSAHETVLYRQVSWQPPVSKTVNAKRTLFVFVVIFQNRVFREIVCVKFKEIFIANVIMIP